ncbi:flagellar motor protein MotB [Chitinophaga caeni]|uniref:Flagellar motor protein MotB n=1 Tax=Chitinophaga caeni TaxID=2029983 RepID=A0A291QTQ3_9BACT|nr:OmpA family protein [Chitinophaga caeni]ATL47315.1 flagellar motor protein MotB [Chitinophaga caeni]
MKKQTLLLACLLAWSCISWAQAVNYTSAGKKAQHNYDKAVEALRFYRDDEAIKYLEAALKSSPNFIEAMGQMGFIRLQLKQYSEAIAYFEKMMQLDPDQLKLIGFAYSKSLAGTGKFQEALDMIQRYLEVARNTTNKPLLFRENMKFAVNNSQPVPFEPKNLGPNINSAEPEYFPSTTIDLSTLIFTRRVKNVNEDFFMSHKDSTHPWSPAVNMGEPINTSYNEGAQNISQDGEMIVFTGCDFPEGFGSCDIYYSIKENGQWSQPQNIGKAINTDAWETQPSLSADNQTLYFVRGTSNHGHDIYTSTRDRNGNWTTAVPLGSTINTDGNETTPFIHADNQTLFFASDGWPGYGQQDIFVSKRQADGSWGKPLNLGYPINTIEEDASLVVAADGKTAYFASDRPDGYGQLDIYSFELYPSIRPSRTIYVKGNVYDSLTREPLIAVIDLIDLSNGQTSATIRSDKTGNFLVPLPVGKDYAFNVNRRGYLFYSDHFTLTKDLDHSKPFERDIPLQPLAIDAEIVLKNIFFATKEYKLEAASEVELNKLVALLENNPGMKVEINGHTDNVGKDEDNMVLSRNRAKSVVDYIIAKGIDPGRITAKGYGETQPVADNNTEEGRAQNRRTTLKILSLH